MVKGQRATEWKMRPPWRKGGKYASYEVREGRSSPRGERVQKWGGQGLGGHCGDRGLSCRVNRRAGRAAGAEPRPWLWCFLRNGELLLGFCEKPTNLIFHTHTCTVFCCV